MSLKSVRCDYIDIEPLPKKISVEMKMYEITKSMQISVNNRFDVSIFLRKFHLKCREKDAFSLDKMNATYATNFPACEKD